MIINRQRRVRLDLEGTRKFVARLKKCLQLSPGDFNVCLLDDSAIAGLNATHRGKPQPTDVLSFPWEPDPDGGRELRGKARSQRSRGVKGNQRREDWRPGDPESREFSHFLGDIVISVETAERNARMEGHSVAREIRWLILHGALHLLGHDHEKDGGLMTRLEHQFRAKLKI